MGKMASTTFYEVNARQSTLVMFDRLMSHVSQIISYTPNCGDTTKFSTSRGIHQKVVSRGAYCEGCNDFILWHIINDTKFNMK